jgi:hypothetical protein
MRSVSTISAVHLRYRSLTVPLPATQKFSRSYSSSGRWWDRHECLVSVGPGTRRLQPVRHWRPERPVLRRRLRDSAVQERATTTPRRRCPGCPNRPAVRLRSPSTAGRWAGHRTLCPAQSFWPAKSDRAMHKVPTGNGLGTQGAGPGGKSQRRQPVSAGAATACP